MIRFLYIGLAIVVGVFWARYILFVAVKAVVTYGEPETAKDIPIANVVFVYVMLALALGLYLFAAGFGLELLDKIV